MDLVEGASLVQLDRSVVAFALEVYPSDWHAVAYLPSSEASCFLAASAAVGAFGTSSSVDQDFVAAPVAAAEQVVDAA